MRSLSVPDQANIKGPKEKQPNPSQKTLRAVSERYLPASEYPAHERAHSKDSEKENIPVSGGDSVESIPSSTNTASDSSTTLTYSSSVTPAKSMALSQITSPDKSMKDTLDLDLEIEKVSTLVIIFYFAQN